MTDEKKKRYAGRRDELIDNSSENFFLMVSEQTSFLPNNDLDCKMSLLR